MADVSGYIIDPSIYGFCADFIITGTGLTKAQADNWYVQDVCLGSTLMYVNGLLEASAGVGAGGATIEYVDGSLAQRDASITDLINYDAIQDASIAAGGTGSDASISELIAYDIIQDASILLLKEYDAIQDASILAAGSVSDASIVDLINYDAIQDSSILDNTNDITRIDAYDAIQDTSILTNKNNITTNANDITRIDAYDAIQDTSILTNKNNITTNANDITRIDAYDAIQDTSILTNKNNITTNANEISQLDASVVRLDAYNIIQDVSAALLDLAKVSRAGDSMSGDLSINATLYVQSIAYDVSLTPAVEAEGLTWWNQDELALNIASGVGPVLQVGQEIYGLVANNTGATLLDGRVVYGTGTADPNGYPYVDYAKADSYLTCSGSLTVLTMDVPNGGVGLSTLIGKVRDVSTSTSVGVIYVSDISAGEFVNTSPQFPSYSIAMGGNLDGSTLAISQSSEVHDTFNNFWNGTFREPMTMDVSSNGTTVYVSVTPQFSNTVLTTIFSDGFTEWADSSVVLTPGTDNNPQLNFVYVPEATKILTANTSDWPNGTEHIKVGTVLLQSAATTISDGGLKLHQWNDPIESTGEQGHMSHITEKLRQFEAQWDSGVQGSIFIDDVATPDDVYFSNTSGVVYQLHRQTFPAFDMSTGSHMHVINHPTDAYQKITNINTQLVDANDDSLQNTSFSFVVWGVQNSGSATCQLMLNLPTGSYAFASPDSAVNDALNYSVYTIPKEFAGTGFLIARFTLTYKSDAWVLYDTEDLRGRIPNTTAGGGGGGSGVTSFTGLTDTPNSYLNSGLNIVQVNVGETAIEFTGSPTITDFGSALHDHSDASNGGTIPMVLGNDASIIRLDAYNVIQDASIAAGVGGADNLYDLDDTSIGFPGIDNQLLAFDSDASVWYNIPGNIGIDSSIYDVVDASDYFWILADTSVDYSTIVQDQTLAFQVDTSKWENKTLVDTSLYAVDDASIYFARRLQIETKTGTADGSIGDWSLDSDYLYLCVADSSWNRIALTGF